MPKSINAFEANLDVEIKNLTQDEEEKCVVAIRNERNIGLNYRQGGGYSKFKQLENRQSNCNKQK